MFFMKRLMRVNSLLVLVCAGLLASCASSRVKAPVAGVVGEGGDGEAAATVEVADFDDDDLDDYAVAEAYDPWEGFNRRVFVVNDGIYTVFFRPVAKGYELVFPKPVRQGVSRAFYNVKYPIRVVNGVLQGKFKRAGQETGRFVVNTVAGVGGLFDVADRIPALADVLPEDSGQTLGVWGIGQGPYLVLPVLGPCSVRDTVGYGMDQMLNPLTWGVFSSDIKDVTEIPAYVNIVQNVPEQLRLYDAAVENAVDPYIAARSSYLQNRKHAVER